MTNDDISDRLLDYLQNAVPRPQLTYSERPVRMMGGYDAAIFSFRLEGASEPLTGPLVLRLFHTGVDTDRAAREAAVQNALAALGYPAPRVFVAEASPGPLGGAFLIMERMPGATLGSEFEGLSVEGLGQILRLLLQLPRVRRDIVRLWGEAQTRLQALPVDAFLSQLESAGFPKESFTFDTCFAGVRAAVGELGLGELRPAVSWLAARRPNQVPTLVICHGDSQPLNVLADHGQLSGVIDWVKVVIADPHSTTGRRWRFCRRYLFEFPPPYAARCAPSWSAWRVSTPETIESFLRRVKLRSVTTRYSTVWFSLSRSPETAPRGERRKAPITRRPGSRTW